jgi:hypothetical protein
MARFGRRWKIMNDEYEMLAAGLPPEADAAWREFEVKVLRKRSDCPTTGELLEWAQRPMPPAGDKLREHLGECDYCRTCVEVYQQALGEPADTDTLTVEGSLLEQVAAKIAERSVVPGRDLGCPAVEGQGHPDPTRSG